MFKYINRKWNSKFGKNVVLNYFFRISTILLGLISVRIYLMYLGPTLYGLWITIATIISWMSSGDFGIGNGLRNELAKAYGIGDKETEIKLIATALNELSKIALVLLGIIILISEVFFSVGILDGAVRVPMYITAFFFSANLVIGIGQSVAFSYQKSWLTTMANCFVNLFQIIFVGLLVLINSTPSLVAFSLIHGICIILPNFILILLLKRDGINVFSSKRKHSYSIELRTSILNIGLQFFALQLCGIILYSTDNVIINYLFGSDLVTKYSIIAKVYDTGNSLFSVLLIALWSAVTVHAAKGRYKWILNKVKEILLVWCVFAGGVVLISLLFNYLVGIWLGTTQVYFEKTLIGLFGLYCAMTAFSSIFVNVLNGMGTIRLQLFLAVCEAFINIPLSIFFAESLDMGIFGVKLATFLCVLVSSIVLPIQAIRILKHKIENQS